MSKNRGRRYDDTPKLNMNKVFATIIAIVVIIMIIVSLKRLLSNVDKTKDVSSLDTYISVYENNKWGVIDNKGNIVIELDNDEMIIIPDKNTGLFICMYDVDYSNDTYKTKVLNENGKEILTEYNNVEPIENTDGSTVWYENNVLKFEENGKYGLINFSGKVILDAEYDNIYALSGIEKSIIIEKDGKKGLVSTSLGEIIIPAEYADITSLSDTYENGYIVKSEENKFGIISADKSVILTTNYDEIKNVIGNNYYVVIQNSVLEVIDSTGKVILNSGFDSVEEISVDNFVIIKNGKYGVINKSGDTVINPEYENLKFAFSNYYIAQKDGKYGIIDTSGNTMIDFTYERISYINTADFIEAENSDYTTDIYDRTYNKILENVIISELNIDSGYLRIRQDNDYKYYNFKFEEKTNKEVLATNTLFLVKENGKYGYENKNGDRIVDCIYDDAKEQNEFGYCAVKKDGLWGALKSDGTVVLTPSVNLDDYLYVDFISTWHRFNDLSLNIYTK
jgi:hypothetical protein